MKFGVQLYGPLSSMSGSTLERLGLLAQAGIGSIEPCISDRHIPGMESVIWPMDWLGGHVEEIRSLELEIRSAHVFAEDLAGALDALKDLTAKTGIVQYVVKTPAQINELSLQQAALTFMKAADSLAEVGVALLLHNEARDIQTKMAGKTAYEHLLDLCMGKVGAQVDVGWVQFGGEDPVEFLARNSGRVKSVHHKDFPADASQPIDVRIDSGAVDLGGCFRYAQSRDIPQIIDQEHFGPDVPGELASIVQTLNGFSQNRSGAVSYLNTYDIESGEVRTLARFDRVIEAPNWLKGSDTILFNSEGHMYAYDIATGAERLIDTAFVTSATTTMWFPLTKLNWLSAT